MSGWLIDLANSIVKECEPFYYYIENCGETCDIGFILLREEQAELVAKCLDTSNWIGLSKDCYSGYSNLRLDYKIPMMVVEEFKQYYPEAFDGSSVKNKDFMEVMNFLHKTEAENPGVPWGDIVDKAKSWFRLEG